METRKGTFISQKIIIIKITFDETQIDLNNVANYFQSVANAKMLIGSSDEMRRRTHLVAIEIISRINGCSISFR